MYQALYRKWRPQTFEDVCGQEHITSVLKYETNTSKFSHAYLFCGSRGTGKTTCAKILAKAVNCESPVNGSPCNKCASCRAIDSGSATDVLEMDAASNNGVDNIRDIRDEVVYTPSALKYRVYIVDEVHMLSPSAFNALLKTLEEPPSHVIFILATTELHKLPATIISRCQRFDFRRITVSDIMARLSLIAQNEGIQADNDALRLIAKYAQGGMRDAISLFELCAGGEKSKLTAESVSEIIGISGNDTIAELLLAINTKDYDTVFSIVDDVVRSSRDISVFWNDIIAFCRDLLICKTTKKPEEYLDITDADKKRLRKVSDVFTKESLLYFLKLLNDAVYIMQRSGNAKRNIAEITLIRMGDESLDASNEALLSRISKLEAQISSQGFEHKAVEKEKAPAKKVKVVEEKAVASVAAVDKEQKAEPTEKMIRGWAEICDKVALHDPSALALLKMSRAYVKEGAVTVKFQNEFALSMFLASKLEDELANEIGNSINVSITKDSIKFEVSQIVSDDDGLDDIFQN